MKAFLLVVLGALLGTSCATVDSRQFAELEKEAEAGGAPAMLAVGCDYYYGKSVPMDYSEAVKWFRKAADIGNSSAIYFLGSCYFQGRGVPKDYTEALKWFRKAAELDQDGATDLLGVCYQYGLGVPKDEAEAIKWYRKADALGYYEKIVAYGNARVAKQHRQAIVKFDARRETSLPGDGRQLAELAKKAETGDAEAMADLGKCYATGDGAPADSVAAMKCTVRRLIWGMPRACAVSVPFTPPDKAFPRTKSRLSTGIAKQPILGIPRRCSWLGCSTVTERGFR